MKHFALPLILLVAALPAIAQEQHATAKKAPDAPPALSLDLLENFARTQADLLNAQLQMEHAPEFETVNKAKKVYEEAQKSLEAAPPGQAVKAAQKPAQAAYQAIVEACAVVKPPAPPKFVPSRGEDGKPVCKAPQQSPQAQ